jgi:hypothetical protein
MTSFKAMTTATAMMRMAGAVSSPTRSVRVQILGTGGRKTGAAA